MMAGVLTVRPMTVADLDAIFPYEEDMFGSEAWSYESYLDELHNTETRYYVVAQDDDGTVLGDAGLMTIAETAQIVTVAVLPHARRRGIGRMLVRHLIEKATAQGSHELILEVRTDNLEAKSLYESEGFSVMGLRRGYYDRGRVDAVTMRLGLVDR